jgi:phosphate-selective porin OprO and OprP
MRTQPSRGRVAKCFGLVLFAFVATLPHAILAQTATPDSSTNERIKTIEQQIQALQQELSRVKADLSVKDEQLRQSQEQTRQVQAQVEAVENRKPLVTFPAGRPTISSEDGQYSLAIGALVQFDAGGYFQNSSNDENVQPPGARDLDNGENLRRGRIYVVGQMGDFTLNITPDFGGSPDGVATIYQANINYTFSPVTVTIGYFQPWFSLYDAMLPQDFLLLERPSAVEIARNVVAGDARASFGAKASGEDYFASLYLTGASYGSQSANLLNDQQTGIVGRVATRPLRGKDWNTHIGINGSKAFHLNENDSASVHQAVQLRNQPELRIDQNRLIDTGLIPASGADTYGIELAANWRNFTVMAEYIRIDVDQDQPTGPSPNLTFQGGYIEGSWVITGESHPYLTNAASYGRPSPEHPFSLKTGGWGAWEVVARYSILDLDSDTNDGEPAASTGGVFGGLQQVYSVGLNWYPNDFLRFQLQFSHVDVDRRDASNGTTQVGQNFEDIALRSQLAF